MSVMNWSVWPKEDLEEVVDAIEILRFLLKMLIGVDNHRISMKVHFTFYTCQGLTKLKF